MSDGSLMDILLAQLFGAFAVYAGAFIWFGWRGRRAVQLAGTAVVLMMTVFGALWAVV